MKQGKFIFYFKTLKSNLYSFVIYNIEGRKKKEEGMNYKRGKFIFIIILLLLFR